MSNIIIYIWYARGLNEPKWISNKKTNMEDFVQPGLGYMKAMIGKSW